MNYLFENHLVFIAKHRGTVTSIDGNVRVDGARSDLSFFGARADLSDLSNQINEVRLLPEADKGWQEHLTRNGWRHTQSLSYLEREQTPSRSDVPGSLHVVVARDRATAMDFATVQISAFLSPEELAEGWWPGHFRACAEANFADPTQQMLVGYDGGEAVACALALDTDSVRGLYAIATHPDYRNRGYARHLTEALSASAAMPLVGLQVAPDSAADRLYRRLGFVEAFKCTIWHREAPDDVQTR